MKKFLLMAAVLFGAVAANAQDKKADELVKVNTENYNFSKIKQGTPVTTFFEITNTTATPVIIENVTASCGCTTPKWSKEPLAPGASSKIEVGYNAAALGTFGKDVYIKLAGASQPKVVKISGEVMEAAAYDAYAKEKKPEVQQTKAAPVKKAKTSTATKASKKK